MKFKVFSRIEFEEFIPHEPFIAISITDPNSEIVQPQNPPHAILSLEFHDADKRCKREDCKMCAGTGKIERFKDINNGNCYSCSDQMVVNLFTEKDAENILDFVAVYKDFVDLIVVHCEVGISRSAGVTAALSFILNGTDQYYFDNYIPNMLCYRKILNAHYNS